MQPSRSLITFGIVLLAFGGVWLLAENGWLPEGKWLLTAFFAGCGVLTFASAGFTRTGVVLGTWFLVDAVLSVFVFNRQMTGAQALPSSIIALGALLVVGAFLPPEGARPVTHMPPAPPPAPPHTGATTPGGV